MSIETLLRPRSIAVVGASPRTFVGQVALHNCRARGFTGSLTPVTNRHTEVAGLPAVASLDQLDTAPDVAIIQVRADRVLAMVEAGIAAGVRGFVVPGAGYTDSGDAALAVAAGLNALHTRHDFELIGANCMGVLDLVTGAATYIGSAIGELRRGSVGVLAQSGAIAEAFVNAGARVPMSTVVSSGSEVITTTADYLEFFAEDPHTSAVLAFVETVTDAERTLAAARRCSEAGKQLAVCLVGRSAAGRSGVAAHSGKLAAGARATAAAFRQCGAVIADDLDELMTFGELFGTRRRLPAGRRVHVVTNSGGEGNLIADIAQDVGVELPPMSEPARSALQAGWPNLGVRNPLDPWGADDYEAIFPEAILRAALEPGDVLLVSIDQQRSAGQYERELGLNLARYLDEVQEYHTKLPVLLSPISADPDADLRAFCQKADIPLLRGVRPVLSALAKLGVRANSPLASRTPVQACPAPIVTPGSVPTEDEALDVLASLGVTTPRRARARTAFEAAAAARELGGAIILKAIAPGIAHKTDLGLVEVAPIDVEAAAQRMLDVPMDETPELLVAEMVRGQLEVIVGYHRDAVFGPTIVLGLGGIWTEVFDNAAIHVGLLDEVNAARLLDNSAVGRMLATARGGALDRIGVLNALWAVSDLAAANPTIASIDINPLIVGRDHATAVDCVIEHQHHP